MAVALVLILSLGVGVAAGVAFGGDRSIDQPAVSSLIVPTAAAGLVVFASHAGVVTTILYVVAGHAVAVAWLVATAVRQPSGRTGHALLGVGGGMNLIPLAANNGMPVLLASGDRSTTNRLGPRHVTMNDETAFGLLGDIIDLPVLGAVISIGDVAMALGAIFLAAGLSRRHTETHQVGS